MRKLLLALVLLIAPLHAFAAGPCAKYASPPNNTGLADGTPVPCYEDGNGNQYVLLGGGSSTIGKVNQGTQGTVGSPWFFSDVIGGALQSATNGGYFNVLQGNAALSATNGIYANLLQGNAALSASNPLFGSIVQGGNTAQVTSGGSLVVSSLTAVGSAPTTPPISISGVDGGGLKRHLLTDVDGALHIVGDYAQASSTSGQLGVLGLTATTTSAPTYTTLQSNPLSTDTHGGTRVLVQGADGTPVSFDPTVPQAVYPNPAGAPITATTTGASTSNVVATLAGTIGKTTYITGYRVSCATASAVVATTVTVAGITTSEVDQFKEASASIPFPDARMTYAQAIPAASQNTAITVTLAAITGGATCSVDAEGYQL